MGQACEACGCGNSDNESTEFINIGRDNRGPHRKYSSIPDDMYAPLMVDQCIQTDPESNITFDFAREELEGKDSQSLHDVRTETITSPPIAFLPVTPPLPPTRPPPEPEPDLRSLPFEDVRTSTVNRAGTNTVVRRKVKVRPHIVTADDHMDTGASSSRGISPIDVTNDMTSPISPATMISVDVSVTSPPDLPPEPTELVATETMIVHPRTPSNKSNHSLSIAHPHELEADHSHSHDSSFCRAVSPLMTETPHIDPVEEAKMYQLENMDKFDLTQLPESAEAISPMTSLGDIPQPTLSRQKTWVHPYKSEGEMLDNESITKLTKKVKIKNKAARKVLGDPKEYEIPQHNPARFHIERDLRKIKYALLDMGDKPEKADQRKYAKMAILKHYKLLTSIYQRYCKIGGDSEWMTLKGWTSLLKDCELIEDEEGTASTEDYHARFTGKNRVQR